MKSRQFIPKRVPPGFTLIALLLVIAIIGILAALIFPMTKGVKANAARNRASTELQFVAAAINSYQQQLGHFPPDNPNGTNINQLYYELAGTTFDGANYTPLSGAEAIKTNNFDTFFGVGSGVARIGGFINTTKGVDDDRGAARNFLTGIKPGQFLLVKNGVEGFVLGISLPGPEEEMLRAPTGEKAINPWRYRISGPDRHNPDSFDLWVDLLINGKTNRISNWADTYEIVSEP